MEILIMNPSKILIIEDTDVIAMDLQKKFKNWGYNSIKTASSQEALEKANKIKPNLIIMDIDLKNENGINLAKKIMNNIDTALIYITDYLDDENRDLMRITRPYGYISKNYEENQIKYTIEDAIYRHKIHQNFIISK